MLVLSAIALAIGVSRFAASKAPLGTMFVVGAVSAALYGAGRISMSRRVQRSADYWRQEPGFIQFGPSRGLGLGDYLPAIVASAGALAAMWMQLSSGAADINGAWTLTLAVFVLLGSVLTLVTVPTGGRGAPEIILTPEAAWIWTGGRKRTCIPWTAQPNLETSIVHRLRPHVMITGGTGGPALLPIFVLPIGHVQFQAVLGFYAAHADLRGNSPPTRACNGFGRSCPHPPRLLRGRRPTSPRLKGLLDRPPRRRTRSHRTREWRTRTPRMAARRT